MGPLVCRCFDTPPPGGRACRGDHYTQVNPSLIPTGDILPVADTVYDFTQPRAVGERLLQASSGRSRRRPPYRTRSAAACLPRSRSRRRMHHGCFSPVCQSDSCARTAAHLPSPLYLRTPRAHVRRRARTATTSTTCCTTWAHRRSSWFTTVGSLACGWLEGRRGGGAAGGGAVGAPQCRTLPADVHTRRCRCQVLLWWCSGSPLVHAKSCCGVLGPLLSLPSPAAVVFWVPPCPCAGPGKQHVCCV